MGRIFVHDALEDVSEFSAPLRKQREEAREDLAQLPEPQPIPDIEDVDPEVFRQHVLEAWRHKDIKVRRKALDRLIVEVVLKPGVAKLCYAWKSDSDAYTYQDPPGPPSGRRGRNRGWCEVGVGRVAQRRIVTPSPP